MLLKWSCFLVLVGDYGYALTWFSKWVLYDIFYHKSLIQSAIYQVLYRTTSTNYLAEETIVSVLGKFLCNSAIFITVFVWLTTIILLITSIKYKVRFQVTSFVSYLKEILPILCISILPFIWYVALTNHTVLHTHFVYRHMLVFLCGFLICLKKSFFIENK